LAAVARGAVASTTATPISYVCINKSSGQLFYLDPCKNKSQTKVEFSTSEQFKACYQASNGVTRKVPESTKCSNKTTNKEIEIKVPDDEDPLYFCVGSDGTMYFKPTSDPTSVPTCPAGQDLVVIGPPNQAPKAAGDGPYSVVEGGTLNMAAPGVLANDTDAEGDGLSAVLVSGPSNASSFVLNGDGSFSYVHNGGETTSDSFTYKANDGTADSNVATVTITVTPVNDAPVANNESYTVGEGGTLTVPTPGVLGNDTDAENDTLNAVLVSGPEHASSSFSLNGDGSFTYVHDGSETTSDSFTYKANDGTADSNVTTVTITIIPVDDAPPLP
jgi:VCBS repeat-containing protein